MALAAPPVHFPTRRLPVAGLARALLAGIGFALLALASIALSQNEARVASIWLPNAFAIAALLRLRMGPWQQIAIGAAMLAGNLLANLVAGDGLGPGLLLALANSAEIAVAVTVIRRTCGPRPDMGEIAEVAPLMLTLGLLAPVASALVASLVLGFGSSLPNSPVVRWIASDAVSLLVLTPGILAFWDAAARPRWPGRRRLAEWLAIPSGGALVTWLVFSQTSFPVLFLIPPIVILHAFRLGTAGTAVSVITTAAVAMTCTNAGTGPVHLLPYPLPVQLALLDAFLASAILVGLPVAAVLATRARLAREVETARRQLALLAANLADAILHYDIEGRCTYASPSVRKVLGTVPTAILGTGLAEPAHPDWRPAIRAALADLAGGQARTRRVTYRRMATDVHGEAVWIEADCTLVSESAAGIPRGIVVSARDVSERVLLEQQLEQALRRAEHAARAKAQFLANMSHEIRTPMNGVLGFAQLIQREPLSERAAHHAELIARSGQSMMTLLNDILDISRIESGQLVLAPEPLDIAALVGDCAALHRANAEQRGLDLTVTCAPDLPPLLISDPLRLRQILLNLVGNAVKFTEAGFVALGASARDGQLVLTVEDSGIGIHPDRIEHVFDPFAQEDARTSRRYGGTGLGLSISRQLAGMLGGTLVARSRPGSGSCITLRLPLETPHADAAPPRLSVAGAPASVPLGRRILLAEDHDVNRLLAVATLEQLGQRVTVVEDGSAAIAAACDAAARGTPFDLVLMDIQMPGCDGYAAARAIRAAGMDGESLPIVALTANAFAEDIAAALDAGMQDHLAKPFTLPALAKILVRWLPATPANTAEAPSSGMSDRGPIAAFPTGRTPSGELARRWQHRRAEALAAVAGRSWGRPDQPGADRTDELARLLHKLAGSAGMFGEADLGACAAALERALRGGASEDDRRRLATALLEAA